MPDSEIHQEVPGSAQGFGRSLHHVQLAMPVGGDDEARRSSQGLLVLNEAGKPPVWRGRGGAWARGPALEDHRGGGQEFRAARKAHPGLLPRRLDELAGLPVGGGVGVFGDPDFPGSPGFHAHDPFGNRLEVLHLEASDQRSQGARAGPCGSLGPLQGD